MSLRTAVLLLALLLPPSRLQAQARDLPPGSRVRVQVPCGTADTVIACRPVVGRVLRAGDGLLIEAASGMSHRIDLETGARLERSAGYRRHTLLGLRVGGLLGLGAGAVATSGCTTGGSDDELCGLNYLYAVPVGAAVGALFGALTRTERWRVVSPSTAALHVRPQAGRTAIALTIGF